MADLGGQFDASEVPTLERYTPIPAGEYRAAIVKSEFKPTKNQQGQYLEVVFQILEGPSEKRMISARLNLVNPNSQAVEIARKELSSICHACGKIKVRDSAELHDIPVIISIAITKRADNGEPSNEIKGYMSVKDFAEKKSKQGQNQPVAAGAGSSNGSKPAWM